MKRVIGVVGAVFIFAGGNVELVFNTYLTIGTFRASAGFCRDDR